jgi:plasmid stabilization system protein ParE
VTHAVRRHVDVENDILDLAAWIARDSKQAAYRFLAAVEDSILSLRLFPGRGSPKRLRDRRLAGVRSLAVAGFPKHLILYEQRGKDVYVLAVIHGARNYRKLLRDRSR